MIPNDLLCVGDVIKVINRFGVGNFPITRVTKTLAFSKREDGYERSWKRKISANMSHPYDLWDKSTYTIKRQDA